MTALRAGLIVLAVGASACGQFTPGCERAAVEQLSYPTFAATQPTTGDLVVLSANARETYCAPYLTVYSSDSAGLWQAQRQIDIESVQAGEPSLPVAAQFAADGSLWIAERRGQRVIKLAPSLAAIEHIIHVGIEPSALVIDDTWDRMFVADATASTMVIVTGLAHGSDVVQVSTEVAAESVIKSMTLAGNYLLLGYSGGTLVSRLSRSSLSWDLPISPFEGATLFDPDQMLLEPQSGDVIAALASQQRVVRLYASEQYLSVTHSPRLGLPRRVSFIPGTGHFVVHDDRHGDWVLDANLSILERIAASPAETLAFWLPITEAATGSVGGLGGSILDTELQTW